MNKPELFNNRSEWRSWLKNNHNKCREIWLIYFKKHTNKESVKQNEAVEEALCYGWIDSIVKTIDNQKYMQKFTPRNEKSVWSDLNKHRVNELIKNGKMTKHGLIKVEAAKKNGMWNKIRETANLEYIPLELERELNKNNKLYRNWENYSPSAKKQFLYWINTAKKESTKNRRLKRSIELILDNKKLGMV